MSITSKEVLPPDRPAILDRCGVARIIGCPVEWVDIWDKKDHLHSLGGAAAGCQRYYSTKYVLGLRDDHNWLDEAIRLVRRHFRSKNSQARAKKELSNAD